MTGCPRLIKCNGISLGNSADWVSNAHIVIWWFPILLKSYMGMLKHTGPRSLDDYIDHQRMRCCLILFIDTSSV